jgi:hypothetical protein
MAEKMAGKMADYLVVQKVVQREYLLVVQSVHQKVGHSVDLMGWMKVAQMVAH